MVRSVLSADVMAAFSDELVKIAVAPSQALKMLKSGPFSTNIGKPSSIKMTMPRVRSAPPPPVGRITTTSGSSIAAQMPGVNLRPKSTASLQRAQSPSMDAIAPASPIHVAPQTTPVAAPARQGAPQTVSTTPQASTGSPSSSAAGGGGQRR